MSDTNGANDGGEQDEDRLEVNTAKGVSLLKSIISHPTFSAPVTSTWFCPRYDQEFPIRGIDPDLHEKIQKDAEERKRNGKSVDVVLNNNKFKYLMVLNGLVEPNIMDANVRREIAAAKNRPNDIEPTQVLKMLFLSGEIEGLAVKILELSGFGEEEDIIDALKGRSSDE